MLWNVITCQPGKKNACRCPMGLEDHSQRLGHSQSGGAALGAIIRDQAAVLMMLCDGILQYMRISEAHICINNQRMNVESVKDEY